MRRSEPVKVVEPVIIPKAVIKPPKPIDIEPVKPVEPVREKKAPKLPKALLDALEAERWDQTYKGQPKRTLKQLKKAVERERFRA